MALCVCGKDMVTASGHEKKIPNRSIIHVVKKMQIKQFNKN
jgi:hypothetical protein